MYNLVVLWKITDYTAVRLAVSQSVSQVDNDTIFKDTWKMHKNVDNKIMNSILHLRHTFQCSFFPILRFTNIHCKCVLIPFLFSSFLSWFRSYPRVSFNSNVFLCYCAAPFHSAFSIILQYKVVKRSIKWMCSIFRNWDCAIPYRAEYIQFVPECVCIDNAYACSIDISTAKSSSNGIFILNHFHLICFLSSTFEAAGIDTQPDKCRIQPFL